MGANTGIEWCHATFNPWRGCTKVSAGCKNCYAETMSGRNPAVLGVWGPRGTRVVAAESYWRQPIKWNAAAAAAGERHRVFCASLADVFEGPETMPASEWPKVVAARARLFDLISDTPNLDWLLLTKRPQNIMQMLIDAGRGFQDLPPWVWIGTSVEDQAAADERIPHLLRVPARVRFLSCEPLLGPVDLREWFDAGHESGGPAGWVGEPIGIHWVIVGGESGAGARPMHPEWARSLRDQCVAAGVKFFFKQTGEWVPYGHIGSLQDEAADRWDGDWTRCAIRNEHGMQFVRVGKHRAGRQLDGRNWDETP